jgi:hypothetical protein
LSEMSDHQNLEVEYKSDNRIVKLG